MIWYLLYPIRGTTEAPVLPPNHPLRAAFTRYARFAARHVVATLLISVAVAAALIYPFPFLYSSDFTNGASNLPHHVWTNAQPLVPQTNVEPDVTMRSIWVHGTYMRALDREVLLGALELQDELLGPTKNFNPRRPTNSIKLDQPVTHLSPTERDTFHVINGLTNQSWFFHSPLQYWGGDAARIEADPDIRVTVNERKKQPTSVNVTLRHSTVFSGKRFEDRALVAADALVITLIHMRDSPVGRLWERNAEDLAARVADKWTVYPRDGRNLPSQPYEFQFLPISFRDSVLLFLAYLLTFLYFMLSLSRMRAMKSKPGLILTVVVQIFASIMSSFTTCAIFKIDLSRMPRASYPIVVASLSLENMFRLINAVIATRSEDSSSSRIGQAFGQTTHIAAASVMQYLLILGALSYVVPIAPISAFCAFAGVATIFDFFYLSTFFLAVLSAEVRRMELSEALEKSSSNKNNNSRSASQAPQNRQSWAEAVLQGKTDVSTRIAGTIVMLGFVLIAQWHFFGIETAATIMSRLFNLGRMTSSSSAADYSLAAQTASSLTEVHQARSPTSWLRLQDHETAREVIQVIKPHAHSYIARVYDPIVFVLKGSDRMPSVGEPILLPAVYDFVRHQSKPFLVSVLVIVAAVRILMNYLLWDETAESKAEDDDDAEDPLLSVKTMSQGHTLDVVMMTASSDGLVVSVGLDRLIQALDVRSGNRSHTVADPKSRLQVPFPILAMAIDSRSHWLAILSSYSVVLWSLTRRQWGPSIAVDLCGQKPEAFFFTPSGRDFMFSLVVVRRNGTMVELWPQNGDSIDAPICRSPLVCAISLAPTVSSPSPNASLSIIAATRRDGIYRVTFVDDKWESEEVVLSAASGRDVHSLVAIPLIPAYLVGRSRSVELVDLVTATVVHTFHTEPMVPRSLRFSCFSKRHSQLSPLAFSYFTIAYTSADSGDCVSQTYLPEHEGGLICFCLPSAPSTKACCPWGQAKLVTRHQENPGVWEALPNGTLIGIRNLHACKKHHQENTDAAAAAAAADSFSSSSSSSNSLRQRSHRLLLPTTTSSSAGGGPGTWEVWSLSHLDKDGDLESVSLDEETDDGRSSRQLLISELGPLVKVGSGSVAVGFGNNIKVVSSGHEHFENPADLLDAEMNIMNLVRKKRTTAGARHRSGHRA